MQLIKAKERYQKMLHIQNERIIRITKNSAPLVLITSEHILYELINNTIGTLKYLSNQIIFLSNVSTDVTYV